MATVTNQDKTHALYPTLNVYVDSRTVANACRLRPRRRSRNPRSPRLQQWRAILGQLVAIWRAMSIEDKTYYRDNAPAYYKSGYNWYLSQQLKAAAKRGHWEDGV